MLAFSVISISIMLIFGIVLYARFSILSRHEIVQSTQKLMEQTREGLEDYLISMRQISDAAYYHVIKESDFSSQDRSFQKALNLLYEAHKEKLRSIAVYNNHGSLLAAEPVASQKEDPDVTRQDWYEQAMGRDGKYALFHSAYQNLFDDGTFRYNWVISLSRAVELTLEAIHSRACFWSTWITLQSPACSIRSIHLITGSIFICAMGMGRLFIISSRFK